MFHSRYRYGDTERPWTWRMIRGLQIALWGITLLFPTLIVRGLHNNHHDRQSLHWPTVPGVMFRSETEEAYSEGRRRGYRAVVAYSYHANGQHYVGNLISLWNPRGDMESGTEAYAFVAQHGLQSTVDVYYDPQHPEIAVLQPGADEKGNVGLMLLGGILTASFGFLTFRTNNFFNRMIVWRKANPPKMPGRQKEKIDSLPHGFVSYEPGCKRKLNCYENRDDLDQFLGDEDEKALQTWKPGDRIIDAKGQEYRLVPNTNKTRYNLEATSAIWTWEKLLAVAVADTRLMKKDPDALRRQVTDAPVEKRIPVLLKCIDDLPAGQRLEITVVILFLVVFFFAVFFGTALFFGLLGKIVHLSK